MTCLWQGGAGLILNITVIFRSFIWHSASALVPGFRCFMGANHAPAPSQIPEQKHEISCLANNVVQFGIV
jgi:hypothetical protein